MQRIGTLNPQNLRHPWLSYVKGHICTAPAQVTCTTGKGRHLDYIVASESRMPYISSIELVDVPWKPHVGLSFSISSPSKHLLQRCQRKPMIPSLSAMPKPARHLCEDHDEQHRAWQAALTSASTCEPKPRAPHNLQVSMPWILFGSEGPECSDKYALFIKAVEVFHAMQAPDGANKGFCKQKKH